MWASYEPNIKATIAFLKLLNVKVNKATADEVLQNHPDWPSLLCISDSLNKWHIPNAAGRINKNEIEQLPVPFLAYTHNREYPLAIVTNTNDGFISFKTKGYGNNNTKIPAEDFGKIWDGVYLLAEPNQQSGEPNYKANKRKAFFNTLVPVAAFIVIAGLSISLLQGVAATADSASYFSIAGIYLQYLILLSGVIVTSLLLWYEVDKNNPLLQKVCTGIAKGDCTAILTGKQSKLFNWLTWSEIGFYYFTGGLLTLLFAGNNITNAVFVLAWLNILALPYTVFSIYYQWQVAKQWCVLCLAVQALLVLGAINILANNLLTSFTALSLSFIINTALLYLLPVLLWKTTKPYIMHLQQANNTKREYLRIKFNAEIFETLLKKQKAVTLATEGLGIDLGNPKANNTLIKVCNPYCGPCSKAHPEIEKLLEENSNVKARIIFTATNADNDIAATPVRHLMAIAANNEAEQIKKALDDWYGAGKKDYDVFACKHPMNGELQQQDEKIEAMSKWCKAMNVVATPTIFINGYQLPDAYSIGDLKYFLAE